jgi:hypothetical protein
VIHYAPVPHAVFAGPAPAPNELRLQLDPDRMALAVNVNGLGDPFTWRRSTWTPTSPTRLPAPTGSCCSQSSPATRVCQRTGQRRRRAGASLHRSWLPGPTTRRPCRTIRPGAMDRAEHDPKLHQADPEAEVGGADGALVLDPEPRRTGLRRKLVQSLIVVAQRSSSGEARRPNQCTTTSTRPEIEPESSEPATNAITSRRIPRRT